MVKENKVDSGVRISPTMKMDIIEKGKMYNTNYADMFRLLLVLGQVMLKTLEKSNADINEVMELMKEEN